MDLGFYDRIILPRLIELAMRNSRLAAYKHAIIETARGRVLEVGVGSGVNLPLYGPSVDRVCAIDPSPELLDRARKRLGDVHVPVSLFRASAEQLPFAAAAFDTLVMTWTLCSIPNPGAALAEMRRVLGPGGRLLFVEHGLSPEPGIIRWQHRLTPCWKRIGGGCHLDRKMDDLIRAAGFRMDALEIGYMKGPKPWTFTLNGWQSRSRLDRSDLPPNLRGSRSVNAMRGEIVRQSFAVAALGVLHRHSSRTTPEFGLTRGQPS